MAVNRQLISERFPYLPLLLSIGGFSANTDALVDSSFDGDIAVPPGLVGADETPDHYLPWIMADGSVVLAPAFLGVAHLGSFGPLSVIVTQKGDEPLLGRGAIDRFKLTLDHGHRVILEP